MNIFKSMVILVFIIMPIIPCTTVASLLNLRFNGLNKSLNQTVMNKSPYWEYVLREFVFKTISTPPQTSNILYKKLLEAPFYGGPLPTASNEDNALLSRGNVYHLSNGQWILCQDNCNDCILCKNQKNSIVKWILRRIKRFISADSYRYDLQLTVIPQLNNDALKNFQTDNYVNVPRDSFVSSDIAVTTKMSHIDRPKSDRSSNRIQRDDREQINRYNLLDNNEKSSNKNFNILPLSNNENNVNNSKYIDTIHRLIMGIDQSGQKQIIHVVSIGSSEISNNNTIDYQLNQNTRKLSYHQYINKLLESIHSHRPIIDAFLLYNQIKKDNSTASFYPVYSEFIDNNINITNNNNTNLNLNVDVPNDNNRPKHWSDILTNMSRNKNYIPKLVKKFNGNLTNIIRSQSISLF